MYVVDVVVEPLVAIGDVVLVVDVVAFRVEVVTALIMVGLQGTITSWT